MQRRNACVFLHYLLLWIGERNEITNRVMCCKIGIAGKSIACNGPDVDSDSSESPFFQALKWFTRVEKARPCG